MQIHPEAVTFFGWLLAGGGLVFAVMGVLNKRHLDRLTAQIDEEAEAAKSRKAV